jgi:hypothetical protein
VSSVLRGTAVFDGTFFIEREMRFL